VLSAGPANQVAAGATGAGAAGVTREKGGGPVAQLAAGLGGATVASAPSALAEGVKRLIRGGAAGSSASPTTSRPSRTPAPARRRSARRPRRAATRRSKACSRRRPGSAGTIAAKADQEAAGLSDKVGQMATTLAPRAGAEPAGRAITSGIKAFTGDFKKTSGKLYDEIDRFILPDSKVRVGETSKALDDLTKLMPGAENLSAQTINPKITAIKEALASDAQHGTLPYAAVKELRSRIGKQLTDPDLVSDAPRAQLKQLYGALTKDLEVAAADAGPDAVQALKRANNFYRAGMKRVDDVLEPILNKGDPEKIFQAAISGTKEGSTTISGVMKSLPDESRKVVAATMLRRLGKATASKQDDLAEVFSPETFLTNWNKITPDSKRVLFSALPGSMRGGSRQGRAGRLEHARGLEGLRQSIGHDAGHRERDDRGRLRGLATDRAIPRSGRDRRRRGHGVRRGAPDDEPGLRALAREVDAGAGRAAAGDAESALPGEPVHEGGGAEGRARVR
jgi:hypothetical protein